MSAADSDLRVLVTGAGSRLGFACAYVFAERGAELILCDHDGTALTRSAEELNAFSRFCDAIADNSIAVFAAELYDRFPSIDVLINAAGQGYVRSLAMTRMSRALLPLMRRGRGRRLIVNIAPAGGFGSNDGMFPYASSEAAFERLSEALAEQTKGSEIDVVTVNPELVRAAPAAALAAKQLYQLQRVNDEATAEAIFDLVCAARPEWCHREPPAANRRA